MTQLEAIIEDGRIHLTSTEDKLPPKCRALITILSDDSLDPIFDVDSVAVETGISDLAENLDHYLYGKEKK